MVALAPIRPAGNSEPRAFVLPRHYGICLYPILDYPGCRNNRHCETGLLDPQGTRPVHRPLAEELRWQQARFADLAHRQQPAGCHGLSGPLAGDRAAAT
jgi:hypothetical protein